MKVLATLLLFISITAVYAAAGDGSKVKTVKELRYKASIKFGELIKDELEECVIFTYDEQERLLEESRYNPDGSLDRKTVCKYAGDPVEQMSCSCDSVVGFITVYAYDEKGREIEHKHYTYEGDRANLYQRIIYVYDDEGNLVESTHEDAEIAKTTLKYDRSGNILEKTYVNSYDGSFNERNVYRYSEQGKLVETESYDYTGNLLQREIYSYNAKGEMIESNAYKSDDSLLYCKHYTCNENGKVIDIKFHQLKKIIYSTRQTFQYDEQGNLIEDTYSHSNGSLKIYKYKYDSKGNKIEEIEYIKSVGDADITNIRSRITERKIEYFEE
jgi:YD repeat-containing protein